MKLLILAAIVATCCARPDVSHIVNKSTGDKDAQILSQELDVGVDGKYQWALETSNGIAQHEHGHLNNPNAENAAIQAQGAASWISPEGEQVKFEYVADENGYQPQGSHLPTPPPIPEAILRSLEYIRAHPPPPESN